MKVIDSSELDRKGPKAGLLGKIGSKIAGSEGQDSQAQQVVIAALQKVLDNKYVMLCNTTLEGPDVPIPLILVGPPGVRIIYATEMKGVFRASEDSWEIMDNRTNRFRPVRPNLLTRTMMMGQAVQAYLAGRNQSVLEVESVLFFSDPGVHIEMTRPVVRIVLADALERYIGGLVQSRAFLDQEAVHKIVAVLRGDRVAVEEVHPVSEKNDAFSLMELPADEPRPSRVVVVDHSEPSAFKKVPFTSRQLIFLGFLLLVNIIIIVSFVVLILVSS